MITAVGKTRFRPRHNNTDGPCNWECCGFNALTPGHCVECPTKIVIAVSRDRSNTVSDILYLCNVFNVQRLVDAQRTAVVWTY